MGDQVKDDQLLNQLKSRDYSMYQMETKNKRWIEKARKNYAAKMDKQGDNVDHLIDGF